MSAARKVAPTDLRDFLKSQGWSLVAAGLRDRLYVLENSLIPQRQLVFPMDASAVDYDESVDSVLDKLADISRVDTRVLLGRISCLNNDVLRFRVFNDANDNVLPLTFASVFVHSPEKLLKSAASTVLRPRIHHPRLGLNEAIQFVEKSRFGQTENGSFVLRVECPIHAMEVQGSVGLADDMPFVRQVTVSLQVAVSQLMQAIEADQLNDLVDNLKRAPVPLISSNLCEAISGMHDESNDNSLEISTDWSPLRTLPPSLAAHPVPIRIQRDYFSRIEEVQRELRSAELHDEDTFIGTVERLEGEMGPDGRRSGIVVLSLLLPDEGETVRARTMLGADDYAAADQAHMTNGAYIRITGKLKSGRQPRQLTNATRFEVINPIAVPPGSRA